VQLGLRSISVVSTGLGLGDTCRICSPSKLTDPVRRTFGKIMLMVKGFIPVSINAEGNKISRDIFQVVSMTQRAERHAQIEIST
jgi:hypothetical protein